ncbi:MAG: hypothetical protein A2138_26075 [Deltaproteobacteria bacterium RBG_16_71_12]|nr:MAG: hypothetical protein A2138_26075 [Deltaproteobacteria bacterium RBG_16_71_12]
MVACTNIDSDDLDTDAMQPTINVRSTEGAAGSSVSVVLHVGDSPTTFVELQGDDTLTATAAEQTVTLEGHELLGVVEYNGNLDTDPAGDVVTVAFTRTEEGKESAPDSNVALTEPLALTAPAGGATASRAADLEIAWTSETSEDQVRVSWSGGCVEQGSRDVTAGSASLTLEGGSIVKREQGENEEEPVPDECDVSLTVSRSRSGTIDPGFGGGSISHTFSDSVTFASQP